MVEKGRFSLIKRNIGNGKEFPRQSSFCQFTKRFDLEPVSRNYEIFQPSRRSAPSLFLIARTNRMWANELTQIQTPNPMHNLSCRQDFMLWKLDAVARLGYAAFALDLFGTGHALWNRAESLAARRPITEDRSLLQSRAAAGVQVLRESQGVDANCLAAVGYCFGGMAVLDLARMSPPVEGLKAVASLHGILVPMSSRAGSSAGGGEGDRGAAPGPRVVVLHASGDPFVPPEQVLAFVLPAHLWSLFPCFRLCRRSMSSQDRVDHPYPIQCIN